MGLLDNYTGVGLSPRPKWRHQNIMSNLHIDAGLELRKKGLRFLTESTVTNDWNDLAPDLVIFDRNEEPLSMIEITTHKQLNDIIDKCYVLIERFPEAEYFVYDYEAQVLYQYIYEDDTWISSEEAEIKSQYLDRPLIDYLYE